jgi:hypothetical protein
MGTNHGTIEPGRPNGPVGEMQSRRDEVQDQLSRVLQDQLFRSSKHYTALLRYVVEQTLLGRTAHLKERVLGTEVFGRNPGYDTNQDPVVRTSACEIRKRLGHYYENPAHAAEIRIDLPAGSYVPEIRFPAPAVAAAGEEVAPVAKPASAATVHPKRYWRRLPLYAWAVLPAAAAIFLAVWLYRGSPGRVLERFWGPVWGSSHPVILCVSEPEPERVEGAAAPGILSAKDSAANDRVAFPDALSMARIVGLLRERGRSYQIRRVSDASLLDLRKGSVVLLGGLSNPWIVRFQERQRFYVERDEKTGVATVRDRDHPADVRWRTEFSKPYSELREDYAIVSRFADPITEGVVVILAGLGKDGATAAGEFVTDAAHLRELDRRAPAGWERKNLQAVIGTTVMGGEAAAPRILATDFR